MKTSAILTFFIGVIAISLAIIALNIIGLIPSAHAQENKQVPAQTINVPINKDGSINVKVIGTTAVNIERVAGHSLETKVLPVEVR